MRLKSYELETKEYLCFFHSKRVFLYTQFKTRNKDCFELRDG